MRRMISLGQKGLVAALEDEAQRVDTPAADETAGDGAENLETEMIEVADSGAEVEELAAETEEAGEVAEALESIAVALGVSAANGGMDKHSAAVANIAIGALYKRVGVRTKAMPALESFGQNSSRVGATTIAMETVMEQVGKIWDAIIAAIEKAIAWVVDHFNKVFGAAEKLEKRASALEERADNISGTAKEKTFENERLVKALAIAGSVATAQAGNAANLTKFVKDTLEGAGAKAVEAYGEGVLKSLENPADAAKSFKLERVAPAGYQEVSNPDSVGLAAARDGLTVFRSAELPGNAAFIAYSPKTSLTGEAAVSAAAGVSMKMGVFNGKATAPTKKDVPVLAGPDAVKTCKAVAELALAVRNYRNEQGKISAIKKKLVEASKAAKKAAEAAKPEERDGFKAAQKIAQAAGTRLDAGAVSVSAYALNTGKALLDHVELSLKQYKAA